MMNYFIIISMALLSGCNVARTITCDNGFIAVGQTNAYVEAGMVHWTTGDGWGSYKIPDGVACKADY